MPVRGSYLLRSVCTIQLASVEPRRRHIYVASRRTMPHCRPTTADDSNLVVAKDCLRKRNLPVAGWVQIDDRIRVSIRPKERMEGYANLYRTLANMLRSGGAVNE